MAEERDGETQQLVADTEALIGGNKARDGRTSNTKELVDSAERALRREPEPPKLSPIPLLVILAVVLVLAVIGIYSSFGTAI